MAEKNVWKTTQGHEKMLLYIQKLIRNKFFVDELKKIKESDPEPKALMRQKYCVVLLKLDVKV